MPKALADDYTSAGLDTRDRAMLAYAVKLTREPHSIGVADVGVLREAGFDDTAVLDICQVVSYYNYVNRMAEGLGVELEDVSGALRNPVADVREVDVVSSLMIRNCFPGRSAPP